MQQQRLPEMEERSKVSFTCANTWPGMNLADTALGMGVPIIQALRTFGKDLEPAYIPESQATSEIPNKTLKN